MAFSHPPRDGPGRPESARWRRRAAWAIGWVFGLAVLGNGVFSLFAGYWGWGVLLPLLSLIYIPPAYALVRDRLGVSVPRWLKAVLGFLVTWMNLAVGAVGEIYL